MQTYIYTQMHIYTFSKVWGMQEEDINSLCKLWDLFSQCNPPKGLIAIDLQQDNQVRETC